MSDFPALSVFADAVADRRFVAAVVVAALSGLVRGFSGFGSALIYIPLVSAIYEPRIAAATLLLVDFVTARRSRCANSRAATGARSRRSRSWPR